MSRFLLLDREFRYAVILGDASHNDLHRHYNMHFGVALTGALHLHFDTGGTRSTEAFMVTSGVLIAPNVSHAVHHDPGASILLLSFSPISRLGLYARTVLSTGAWREIDRPFVERVRAEGRALCEGRVTAETFRAKLNDVLGDLLERESTLTLDKYDPRILKALRAIAERSQSVVPAKEIAATVGLSESRFLHLFKSELGITYRRMQIWFRLASSFPRVLDGSDLTEVALEAGFADSAHYSRCFRETFGMPPSALFRGSTLIEVG